MTVMGGEKVDQQGNSDMTPDELRRWKKQVVGRLEILKSRVEQAMSRLKVDNRENHPDDPDIRSVWNRVETLFPEDFTATRKNDLIRHIGFGYIHDFRDILDYDIPAIERAVHAYGLNRDDVIAQELASLDCDIETWELLHPQIRDACISSFDQGSYGDAARKAVEVIMSEIRQRSGKQTDGDALIRDAVRVAGPVSFSRDAQDNNERQVTEGVKQMLQGIYKGIRNPASHGYEDYSRLEAMQIMVLCSFIMGRMR